MFFFFLIKKFSITAKYSKDTPNFVHNKHAVVAVLDKSTYGPYLLF